MPCEARTRNGRQVLCAKSIFIRCPGRHWNRTSQSLVRVSTSQRVKPVSFSVSDPTIVALMMRTGVSSLDLGASRLECRFEQFVAVSTGAISSSSNSSPPLIGSSVRASLPCQKENKSHENNARSLLPRAQQTAVQSTYLYDIQDSPSEGVIAIMNKEGDTRVYFCFFWYINSYAGLGPFKMFPTFLQYRRGRRKKKKVAIVQHAVVSRKYYRYESG